MAILAAFGKQGVNLACGTQNLQPQHHFQKLDILPVKMIPISTCYTSTLLNKWESYVFTSAKFAEISNFWYIIDPKVFPSTSNTLICMPEGLLHEIHQY